MADVLRVLIVDEDPDSRVVTRRALQRAQLENAGEVGYGAAAVSLAISIRPDVILISVEEPVTRPFETAEALANALPDTAFIVYSSLSDAESVRRAMVFGARDYIVKPMQSARLTDAISTVLSQQERHQMRRAGHLYDPSGRGTVIAVTGAKGGIGKSIVAVNLATALHQETGRTVAIFDADTEFGDVATMLDATPERTVGDLLPMLEKVDRDNIQAFMTRHPAVDILAAPVDSEIWSETSPDAMTRIIDLLAQNYDFVVVDTRGSLDPMVRACVDVATLVLLVTSTEVSSIRDTASALRRLQRWQLPPERTKVFLNAGARTVNGVHVEDLREAFGQDVFWQMPFDPDLPASVQVGQPVVLSGKGPAAQNLKELAQRIAGTRTTAPQPSGTRSLLGRILPTGSLSLRRS
jgi:pilus assembly protein CpaE